MSQSRHSENAAREEMLRVVWTLGADLGLEPFVASEVSFDGGFSSPLLAGARFSLSASIEQSAGIAGRRRNSRVVLLFRLFGGRGAGDVDVSISVSGSEGVASEYGSSSFAFGGSGLKKLIIVPFLAFGASSSSLGGFSAVASSSTPCLLDSSPSSWIVRMCLFLVVRFGVDKGEGSCVVLRFLLEGASGAVEGRRP